MLLCVYCKSCCFNSQGFSQKRQTVVPVVCSFPVDLYFSCVHCHSELNSFVFYTRIDIGDRWPLLFCYKRFRNSIFSFFGHFFVYKIYYVRIFTIKRSRLIQYWHFQKKYIFKIFRLASFSLDDKRVLNMYNIIIVDVYSENVYYL